MIQQLVDRLVTLGRTREQAVGEVLGADPADLVMYMERVWDAANPGSPPGLRQELADLSAFGDTNLGTALRGGIRWWDHFGYSFCVENTRAAQIMFRVVRAFRSGEALGVPSVDTQRWLDTTEVLLFGAVNPLGAWLSTSAARPNAEAVRRNAYWRMFAMDLSFGAETNAPFVYDKAEAANRSFPQLFEELLFELWKAIENIRNIAGANAADDDRIYRLAEQLGFMLRSRRQQQLLNREELAASTAMGWFDLTLAMDTPVVQDLRAQATSPGDRLRIIGERVGLAPHTKAASFFSMAAELSTLLRLLEEDRVTGPNQSPLLYEMAPPAIGVESRRVLTEWSAASGRDLKAQKVAVAVQQRQQQRTLVPR
jgi:hypothetical protein